MVFHPIAVPKEQRRYYPDTNSWRKYVFDIEAKGQGQGHIAVMNVCETLSYGDTPMCQIW